MNSNTYILNSSAELYNLKGGKENTVRTMYLDKSAHFPYCNWFCLRPIYSDGEEGIHLSYSNYYIKNVSLINK